MVIDTSALVAILLDEPERHMFNQQIAADQVRLLSAATLVETASVLTSRKGPRAQAELDLYVAKAALEIVPVRTEHVAIACDAYHAYGKGRHPAGLNFGDVFAYALAKATKKKGTDLFFSSPMSLLLPREKDTAPEKQGSPIRSLLSRGKTFPIPPCLCEDDLMVLPPLSATYGRMTRPGLRVW